MPRWYNPNRETTWVALLHQHKTRWVGASDKLLFTLLHRRALERQMVAEFHQSLDGERYCLPNGLTHL